MLTFDGINATINTLNCNYLNTERGICMEDRLDRLESAIFALDDAIDAIAELGKYNECDVECLKDMRENYKRECNEIKGKLAARDAADIAALEREYYRAVI